MTEMELAERIAKGCVRLARSPQGRSRQSIQAKAVPEVNAPATPQQRPKKQASKPLRAHLGTDMMTEENLGELVREACAQLGWEFYWLRKTYNSSKGILDLLLVPTRLFRAQISGDKPGTLYRRHILHRELKGFDARGRLGTLTPAQKDTISLINVAKGDAALWVPADWFSGKILEELK